MTNLVKDDGALRRALMTAVLDGKVGQLSVEERIEFARLYAERLGLDPTLGAIRFIQSGRPDESGNREVILYITAQGMFQLAARHKVSFRILQHGHDDSYAWALVEASTPDGRVVQDYGGALLQKGARRLSVPDAIMTAITKAKARCVRSLFGLPLDESEAQEVAALPADWDAPIQAANSVDELVSSTREVLRRYPEQREAIRLLARMRAEALSVGGDIDEKYKQFFDWIGSNHVGDGK